MAKRIEGATEKLLACAQEEFLVRGYDGASLRAIAEKAGYTKGAIYIRYPDKESLYRALVERQQMVLRTFGKIFVRIQRAFRRRADGADV